VITLRGSCPETEWYTAECEATAAAGISQEDVTLSAKRLPAPAEVRRVIEVLDRTETPVLIHCQRGADRTGLVSAIAVLLQKGSTLDQARRQLWPRYGHIEAGRTAVMDEFFDLYAAWLNGRAHKPNLFRDWVETGYCPGPYRAALSLVGPNPATVAAGRGFTLTIHAANTSVAPWTFRPGGSGGVQLRYQLFTPRGEILYKGRAGHLAATVPPGGWIDLAAGFPPLTNPGRYLVHADLMDAGALDLLAADFVQYGSEPLVFDVNVR